MGNTAPRRTAAGTEAKRSKNFTEASAAPTRGAVTLRKQWYDEERKEEVMTGRRRSGCGDGGATVATVKIVMRRKDAEALVARLEAQNARERRARMAELKRELRSGDERGGARRPAWCLDTVKPRLGTIQEN